VRETLFNLLAHGGYGDPPPPEGRRVLDLFAGTGALGLEALSRGAERALFVDDFAKSRALIRQNVEKLGVIGQTRLFRRDATRLGPCRDEPYDLIFLDPPYGTDLGVRARAAITAGGWAAPGALAVWEAGAEDEVAPAPGDEVLDLRRYADTWVTILRLSD
jgi:16S rRNA (guanine966-N2)-methyltransferase